MMIGQPYHWTSYFLLTTLTNLGSFCIFAVEKTNFEAAFQGECQSNGPCQHLCFDLHDGTFECACKPGYSLSNNGYSCLENPPSSSHRSSSSNGFSRKYLNSSRTSLSGSMLMATIEKASDTTITAPNTHPSSSFPILSSSSSHLSSSSHPDQVYYSCDKIECEAGGICVEYEDFVDHRVRCKCPLGRGGLYCEKPVEVRFPRFRGHSYLALPTLRNAQKVMQVTIEFKPEYHDGILLYTGEKQNLDGDFIAIILYQGFVEFRFDCGMGEGIIRSEKPVVLDSWNTLTILRDGWSAWLQLNSGQRISGQSKGLFSRITFKLELFLGGSPNISLISARANSRLGFVGCVRKLEINGHSYDFRSDSRGDAIDGVDTEECNSDVCSNALCLNGGQCVATSPDRGICLCPLGFAGDNCESKSEYNTPSFNGSSYLQFTGLKYSALSFVEIQLTFKPTESSGLILYNGNQLNGGGDFISINLVESFIEFRFDLGSGPANIRSSRPLELGQWHTLRATRTGTQGILKVDDQPETEGYSLGGYAQLSLSLNLFIGGVSDMKDVSLNSGAKYSYSGCIKKVTINGRNLAFNSQALSGVNVADCSENLTSTCIMSDQKGCSSSHKRKDAVPSVKKDSVDERREFSAKVKHKNRHGNEAHDYDDRLTLDNLLVSYKNELIQDY